jgi:hypothetical protein
MTPEAKKRKIGFLVEEKAVAYGRRFSVLSFANYCLLPNASCLILHFRRFGNSRNVEVPRLAQFTNTNHGSRLVDPRSRLFSTHEHDHAFVPFLTHASRLKPHAYSSRSRTRSRFFILHPLSLCPYPLRGLFCRYPLLGVVHGLFSEHEHVLTP